MEDIKVILEKISKGDMTISDVNKELLIMYGIKERYFFHFGEYIEKDHENYVTSEELIEVDSNFYHDTLLPMEKKIKDKINKEWHRPVKYMSNEIPDSKKVKSILYN